jgi:hypothetical protein
MENILSKNLIACIAVIAFAGLLTLPGCSKHDAKPSEAKKVTDMLTAGTGTWATSGAGSITVGGIDVTQDLFPGFSITFSESTFSTTGTSPVWLRQDTWTFKDETATVIIRGQDSKEITLTQISATQLTLQLTWDQTTYAGGREKSVAGTYTFVLDKNK